MAVEDIDAKDGLLGVQKREEGGEEQELFGKHAD